MDKYTINFTLITDFKLSDKAVFAYVAILMTYQLRKYQILSPVGMVKNIFGPEATKIKILRQGINELVEKEVIKISYKEDRTILYDLTFLAQYNCKNYLVSDNTFFKCFSDLSISVCNLYRLYSTIVHLINGHKKKGTNVLDTYKGSLASHLQCERHVIADRLKKLEELGFINYQDCSNDPVLVFEKRPTLFITLPKYKHEITQILEDLKLNPILKIGTEGNRSVENERTQPIQEYASEKKEEQSEREQTVPYNEKEPWNNIQFATEVEDYTIRSFEDSESKEEDKFCSEGTLEDSIPENEERISNPSSTETLFEEDFKSEEREKIETDSFWDEFAEGKCFKED